jgi:glycosyltransferase involved in cell wall biosynthesis
MPTAHRIHWPSEYDANGNSFGYSVHNREARRALLAQGYELDADAPVALQVAPAQHYRPAFQAERDKLNILFTAWESTDLTPDVKAGLARADVIVVPATFLVDVIRRELPGKPVHYCPLGVDVDTFAFRERREPKRNGRFRFLWLGAPNARKGWQIVLEAWRGYAKLRVMAELEGRPVPAAELYVKTSVTSRLKRLNVPGAPVTFDSRKLPRTELAALYASAHCFLFPSFGEGFGLTMAEAMATGCPVIYTPWSAMTDLADEECGYPLRYELFTHDLAGRDSSPEESRPVTFARADAKNLLRRMLEIMTGYRKAARRGRLAARRIRERFTWERTGRTLARIVEKECRRRLA